MLAARWVPFLIAVATPVLARAAGPPARTEGSDASRRLDVNRIGMTVTNFGSFGFDIDQVSPGLEFPRGSGKFALFAGGLWLSAKVSGSVRVAAMDYQSEYVPGPMANGTWTLDSPNNRVFEVARVDTAGYGAWMAIAAPLGAPTDGSLPAVSGDQTAWSVCNDADATAHHAFGTAGLGIEVQQTSWAFDRAGELGNTVFMRFRLINKGGNQLDSTFVSLWTDPDLGGYADDLVGVDPAISLAYVYNGTDNDAVYGSAPPALGVDLLQGPRADDGVHRLSATAFVKLVNGTDPQSAQEVRFAQMGRTPAGSVLIDPTNAQPTTFQYPGDPVTFTGWRDFQAGDRRMLLTTGPFTFAPGDTEDVVYAIVIGEGSDRFSSITALRVADDRIQAAFDGPVSAPADPSRGLALRGRGPEPFKGAAALLLDAPVAGRYRVFVADAKGRVVARLLDAELPAGPRALAWDARESPPGVYFVRATGAGEAASFRLTKLR